MRAIGYSRVSTELQGTEGHSLGAQQERIAGECERRDWMVIEQAVDIASGSKLTGRPRLTSALYTLEQSRADVLVVARLDRLSRSVGDFAVLMDTAREQGWSILCLDPMVDMTTPYGRAMAGMAAVFAQLERELISQRTKEGLERARAMGVRIGRPRSIGDDVRTHIVQLSESGMSLRQIARELNHTGVPHPLGCQWSKTGVHRLLQAERQAA